MDTKHLIIVIGLGNPGIKYQNTRHNMGFDVVDILAKKYNIQVTKSRHKALIGDGDIYNKKIILVKPQTYMNLSGESVREIVSWYKVTFENIIIVYDDIDIEMGRLRIRPSGGAGTHNGMKSVVSQLNSEGFTRIRVGVGKPPEYIDVADYVLMQISATDKDTIDKGVQKAVAAIDTIIQSGIETAMNTYNKNN